MSQIFDFGDIDKNEAIIRKTWAEFRASLERKEFAYDEIDKAQKKIFLKVFDDLHDHMQSELKKPLSFLNAKAMIRGTKIKLDEVPDYSRMLPMAKYITDDNRFSPPGIEWLYIAIGDNDIEALSCSKAECRYELSNRFASCSFEIDKKYEELLLMDLTISDHLTINNVNNRLEKAGEKYKRRALRRSLKLGIPVPPTTDERVTMESEIEKWALCTYMKLLSEQIFLPLSDIDDKSLMYAPFQCLAQYFITKGYAGILYKSTVSAVGKNVVLFDKQYANPVGNIKIEEPVA